MIDQIWKYIYSAFKLSYNFDMGLDNDFFFLDVIFKAQDSKRNLNKWGYTKLKSFYQQK